jgi:hypothetical protein
MEHVIDTLGGPTAVARMVGCKPPSVIEWRKRGIPADRCPAIERESGGKVKCEQLRDDVVWTRIADDNWPWHPAGRPLIDVAAPRPTPNTLEAGHAG